MLGKNLSIQFIFTAKAKSLLPPNKKIGNVQEAEQRYTTKKTEADNVHDSYVLLPITQT